MIEQLRMSEKRSKNKLFNTSKAVKLILKFLKTIKINRRLNETEKEETVNR
jgi:hypothetical protein